MTKSHVHGFPRIGPRRELKFATEGYWAGKVSAEELEAVAKTIRQDNWGFMNQAGIDLMPSNDFSFYDQVLDAICLLGAVPARYGHQGGPVDLDTYFAMARGNQRNGADVTAMDMTKWFNTNLHYIVPELDAKTQFALSGDKPVRQYEEARLLGLDTVPVVLGPLSFLLLSKPSSEAAPGFDCLSLLDALLPVYEQLLARLAASSAGWVQIDEPVLVQDRTGDELAAFKGAYERLGAIAARPKILINTYFDHVGDAYPILRALPVDGVGLDFVAGAKNEQLIMKHGGLDDKTLFAGVVNGRNIWRTDLPNALSQLGRLEEICDDLVVASSCSLAHVPVDLSQEPNLDPEIKPWLSFAHQKVEEIAALARARNEGVNSIRRILSENSTAVQSRANSPRTQNPAVRERLAGLTAADEHRATPYSSRREAQQKALGLPLFPSTTIGSYPQTHEIREARAKLRKGELTTESYADEMRKEIERVVRFQESAGLDVLVHGEPERNDMVQYFGEQLDGYAFTENGWVQSYGTRCVRPPIIFGDIVRPKPMTVEWTRYAQSLTTKPMKGMLTGPVTMLMWSFVRDDQPSGETCKQLALAIRDEVSDLEADGVAVIQVDEPAIREGLPLRADQREKYLEWAVQSFRLSTSSVKPGTQIQTHMCYSDFGDIIEAIDGLDADVALIEAARSNMELLDDFHSSGYEREIGPGVYDIHSPRVPSVEEMADKLRTAAKLLDPQRVWVNPDCGLKTRAWPETETSLKNMVAAALQVRKEFGPAGG